MDYRPRARRYCSWRALPASRLLYAWTPSPVPGAAGWPPTERPMNCVTPTERRAVDLRGVTDIRTVKRPRS